MEEKKRQCDICERKIEGTAFTLSALDGTSRFLKVCKDCAEGPDVTVEHDTIQVTVPRDDYLTANKERFQWAVEQAGNALDDQGWRLESIEISKRSDSIEEPPDY